MFYLLLFASNADIDQGIDYFKDENYTEARMFLQKGVNEDISHPKYLKARVLLGATLDELAEHDESKKILEKCVQEYSKTAPKNNELALALMYLGKTYSQMGNSDPSKKKLKESIEIFESQKDEDHLIEAKTLLAETYMYTGKAGYPEAEQLFSKILGGLDKEDNRYIWPSLRYARFCMFSEEYKKARDLLEYGIQRLKEVKPEAYDKLGWNLTYLGDVYRNLKLYDKAKETIFKGRDFFTKCGYTEENENYQWCMGWYYGQLLVDKGEYKEAKEKLEKCLEVYKKNLESNHSRIRQIEDLLKFTQAQLAVVQEVAI